MMVSGSVTTRIEVWSGCSPSSQQGWVISSAPPADHSSKAHSGSYPLLVMTRPPRASIACTGARLGVDHANTPLAAVLLKLLVLCIDPCRCMDPCLCMWGTPPSGLPGSAGVDDPEWRREGGHDSMGGEPGGWWGVPYISSAEKARPGGWRGGGPRGRCLAAPSRG